MIKEEKKVWDYCDKKQREIIKNYEEGIVYEWIQGKMMAYREIQHLINKHCSDFKNN